MQILRERCERLEDDRAGGLGGALTKFMDHLRSDMEGLLAGSPTFCGATTS